MPRTTDYEQQTTDWDCGRIHGSDGKQLTADPCVHAVLQREKFYATLKVFRVAYRREQFQVIDESANRYP